MATSSTQIQAEIARTRARISERLNQVGTSSSTPRASIGTRSSTMQDGASTGLVDQIRQRPMVALGLALVGGSLLQEYLSDGSATHRSEYAGGGYERSASTGGYIEGGSTVRATASHAADRVADAAQSAGHTVADTAQMVGQTVAGAAQSVVDTARDAASTVAETTVDVAQRVAGTTSDVAEEVWDTTGDFASSVINQVRRQPFMAVGLSLAAGALLQNYRTRSQHSSGYGGYPSARSTMRGTASQTINRVSNAAQDTGQTVSDVAGSVGQAAQEVASGAVDSARDAAAAIADTTGNVARRAVDSAGNAVEHVSETFSELTWQVQERPLTALAVAIGAGMLLRPTLAPHVSAVTGDMRDAVRSASSGIGELVSLPAPADLQRVQHALVPATVERSRQFINQQARDYLERSLEGLLGQTSLRAGVVAIITEKAVTIVDNQLTRRLSTLSGTPALLALALAGAILSARSQIQTQQMPTAGTIKEQLAQTLLQNAQEQLSQYFPEFRQELQAQEHAVNSCPNCGSKMSPTDRFCPNCGRAITQGTSV